MSTDLIIGFTAGFMCGQWFLIWLTKKGWRQGRKPLLSKPKRHGESLPCRFLFSTTQKVIDSFTGTGAFFENSKVKNKRPALGAQASSLETVAMNLFKATNLLTVYTHCQVKREQLFPWLATPTPNC